MYVAFPHHIIHLIIELISLQPNDSLFIADIKVNQL